MAEQPRCACGFWGSAQSGGLCSKCYKEQQEKLGPDGASSNSSCGISADLVSDALRPIQATPTSMLAIPADPKPESSSENGSGSPVNGSSTQPANGSASTLSTESSETSTIVSEKSDEDETQAMETASPSASTKDEQPIVGAKREREGDEPDPDRPPQKNKKRCHQCNCKLEPTIRLIGKCRCDYIFCPLHRLPEQHNCIFNHKESGRQEAREKMISPKKHVGTSLKRIDSDS